MESVKRFSGVGVEVTNGQSTEDFYGSDDTLYRILYGGSCDHSFTQTPRVNPSVNCGPQAMMMMCHVGLSVVTNVPLWWGRVAVGRDKVYVGNLCTTPSILL